MIIIHNYDCDSLEKDFLGQCFLLSFIFKNEFLSFSATQEDKEENSVNLVERISLPSMGKEFMNWFTFDPSGRFLLTRGHEFAFIFLFFIC